jgi:hypothetical protein
MSNKTELQNNNTELQEILDSVNALPNASGGSGTVVGKWRFRTDGIDQIPLPGEIYVNFTDLEGTAYDSMDITVLSTGWSIGFYKLDGGGSMAICDGFLEDDYYEVIDFGTTPQVVPLAFVEWLANAAIIEGRNNGSVVGKWEFEGSVTECPPDLDFNVNFTCNDGSRVKRVIITSGDGTWQMYYYFDVDNGDPYQVVCDGMFDDYAYQVMNFGATPQAVPLEFAKWLTITATKVSPIIETCYLYINAGSATGTECLIPYVDDNGEIQLFYGYEALYGEQKFRVPKGSAVLLGFAFHASIGGNNLQKCDSFSDPSYNNALYRITDNVALNITQ